MPESFEALRYISYMRSRWRAIAASGAVAVAIAVGVTILMPRQYTAVTRIVIDPPAGLDARSSLAVSPIYLESLKTYEEFASSDSLFQKAIDRFDLRATLGPRPIESLKRRVLKVDLLRNTRIMEISGTLADPRKAQAMANFIAQSTVELARSIVSEGDQELIHSLEVQSRDVHAHMDDIDKSWAQLLVSEPTADLQASLESAGELRATLQQQIVSAQLEIADAMERGKAATGGDAVEIHKEETNARARLDEIQKQLATVIRENAAREKTLGERNAHRDRLAIERKAADTALTTIETRLRDTRAEAGYRGERLRIIDPGVVPERPSSPNLQLNVVAALLLGLLLPIVYFALQMSYQTQRTAERRSAFAMSKSRDE